LECAIEKLLREVELEFKNGTFSLPHEYGYGEIKIAVVDLSELLLSGGMRGQEKG